MISSPRLSMISAQRSAFVARENRFPLCANAFSSSVASSFETRTRCAPQDEVLYQRPRPLTHCVILRCERSEPRRMARRTDSWPSFEARARARAPQDDGHYLVPLVLDPHGGERGNAARLEPRGHRISSHDSTQADHVLTRPCGPGSCSIAAASDVSLPASAL
jgi:hypothetical protein